MYEYARLPHQDPVINPLGGTGDSGTGLYAVVGLLAALRHRRRHRRGPVRRHRHLRLDGLAARPGVQLLVDGRPAGGPTSPRRIAADRSARSAPATASSCCRSPAATSSNGWPPCSATPNGPGRTSFAEGRWSDTYELDRPARARGLVEGPLEPRRRPGARRGRHPPPVPATTGSPGRPTTSTSSCAGWSSRSRGPTASTSPRSSPATRSR